MTTLKIEKQRKRFSRLKECLGIRLNDEDLKMLILEAQKDEGQYKVRPRTHTSAPTTGTERPYSNEHAPPEQSRGSFDRRRKGKEREDTGHMSDV